MRLTVDLRRVQRREPTELGERRLSFAEVAAAAKSPRLLRSALRDRYYGEVRVLRDDLPLSGVQAAVLVAAGAARSRRFEVRWPARSVRGGRLAFLARALATFAIAMPRELVVTSVAYAQARRAAARRFALPSRAPGAGSVSYLRAEPSLQWLGATVGGAATHTAGVINGFAQNGLDVQVYAPERPEDVSALDVTEVPPGRLLHLVSWLTATAYSREVVRVASARRADFVYQRYAAGSYAGLELARRLGVPLVLEFNGSEVWVERNWGSGGARLGAALAAVEERNLRDASLIVVVSRVLAEDLLARGIAPDRVLVNPNGVDVERLAALRQRDAAGWRAVTGQPEAPTVGFVGTFGPWHGVMTLPALIEAVAAERPETRWILIGDGTLHAPVRRELTRRGLDGRVVATGFTPRARTLELLAACDVCVSPHVPNSDGSRFFGSPTKLFEYMGLGKAIVASDLEQIGEVIEHERTGLLSPPGDPEAAAAEVVRLLDDASLRERLGAAAARAAVERHSWRAHTMRILDALAGPGPA